jgi:hypothetical protein
MLVNCQAVRSVGALYKRKKETMMKSTMRDEETLALFEDVRIPAGRAHLEGELKIPAGAAGVVLFANGNGSSRHSPRNQFVARIIRESCNGTLLFHLYDLLWDFHGVIFYLASEYGTLSFILYAVDLFAEQTGSSEPRDCVSVPWRKPVARGRWSGTLAL